MSAIDFTLMKLCELFANLYHLHSDPLGCPSVSASIHTSLAVPMCKLFASQLPLTLLQPTDSCLPYHC